jgi:transcriptional regulator with XRE-family HTH domain
VDRVRVGLIFRALRRQQQLLQADVAARAGVCQQAVSNVERGRFGRMSVDAYCRLAECLGAEIPLEPRWRGPKLARLLDKRHAALQNSVVAFVSDRGWRASTEYTFGYFADRGSVDVLAWRKDSRAVLIVEVKSELDSIEETLRTLNMKIRVAPRIAVDSLGWRPASIGGVLVLPDTSTARDVVDRHSASLGAALPARTVEVKRWTAEPAGPLRGIWFFRDTTPERVAERRGGPDRVWRPGGPPAGAPRPAKTGSRRL